MRNLRRLYVGSVLALASVAIFAAASCQSRDCMTHFFSFPPDSKAHEDNWQYVMRVDVSTTGQIVTMSKKDVQIGVWDRDDRMLLEDDLQLTCATVDAEVRWEEFDTIHVELLEVGNEYRDDAYNRTLIKSGPKRLFEATYQYDSGRKTYRRVD